MQSTVSVNRLGRRVSTATDGTSSTHLRLVNRAIETAIEKKVCATAAWAVETMGGCRKSTVNPPNTAWAITVAKAAKASFRNQERRSTTHVQRAMAKVRTTSDPATRRWLHSNRTPPARLGTLTR